MEAPLESSEIYRDLAAIQRKQAENSLLPAQRELYHKAAERWEILAEQAERHEQYRRDSG